MERISDVGKIFHDIISKETAIEFDNLDSRTLRLAKDVVIDIVGCIMAGHTDASSPAIVNTAATWGGGPECSVLGTEFRIGCANAAFANACLARAYDFGVGGSTALSMSRPPVHISETLVPVAFAVAEKLGASGRELLAGLAAGEDLAGRLAQSVDFKPHLDCRGTMNTLGAAVSAARLHRLSPRQTADAVIIALHQVNGLRQGTQFNLGQGFSAMHAIRSAELAAAGIAGSDDVGKDLRGMFVALCTGIDRDGLAEGLGTVLHVGASFKRFPSCRATHSSIECVLDFLAAGNRPEDVRRITVHVSPWTLGHPVSRPFTLRRNHHADAIFSLQYSVASTLLRGCCDIGHFTEPCITDGSVAPYCDMVAITSDGWPYEEGDARLSSFVDFEMRDGTVQTFRRGLPKGHECFGIPLSCTEKHDKFVRNLQFSGIKAKDAESVFGLLMTLEDVRSLGEITRLLRRRSLTRSLPS